ncbi:cordon-bleu protein-like 1 [Oryzias melastigma]|uniref:Cordon-bleu WH2 repeat protein-like 1a n=1 Tax=Oryzias melastigma TaxID=30732 RepID=A0A3B3B954_ORYME|nr:cordon-bleu protein-like 1 [Oryzias melastigma]
MDDRANPLQREHSLRVVLPGGLEKNATVHGSKPVMDLLVTLCAGYHLNPSDYTVEFLSTNKNNISFKPNSPIGLLEAEKMVLKPKATEEKTKKPYMPEATVRLLINYNKSHKTVVRVSPNLPLEMLLPAVCDKCEFHVETTVLFRDCQSREPLDLRRSLNDHALRELYAEDTALKDPTVPEVRPSEARMSEEAHTKDVLKKENKQKKRGFFSLFRRKKKKHQPKGTASAPASPSLCRNVERGSECNSLPPNSSKKRRAPPPPMLASQSVPGSLSNCSQRAAQMSAESNLRSTKRRAPPPPTCVNAEVGDSLCPLEEMKDVEQSPRVNSSSRSSSPPGRRPSPCSSFPLSPEDSKLHPPSFLGKDLSDARSALAKVLTSSVSKGTLAKRLRNSASFPKFNVSSCISVDSDRREDKDAGGEPESVLDLNLPTESEDIQRRGMTTFTVVPTKKLTDVPEKPAEEERVNEEVEENPVPPEGAENENSEDHCRQTPLDDTSTSPPSLKDSDGQNSPEKPSSEADEEEAEVIEPPSDLKEGENLNRIAENQEEIPQSLSPDPCIPCEETTVVQQEEEVGFPPPPPPVFFKEDGEVPEREASLASARNERTEESSQDPSGVSAAPGPSPEKRTSAPSRFAEAVAMAVNRSRLQSLSRIPEVSGDPNAASARSTYQYGA